MWAGLEPRRKSGGYRQFTSDTAVLFFLIFGVIETVFQPQCGAEG